jgi:hypothetical protein
MSPFVDGDEWLGGVAGSVGRLWSVTLAAWFRASAGKPPKAGGFPPNTLPGPDTDLTFRTRPGSTTTTPSTITRHNTATAYDETRPHHHTRTRKATALERDPDNPTQPTTTPSPPRNPNRNKTNRSTPRQPNHPPAAHDESRHEIGLSIPPTQSSACPAAP